MSYKLTYEFPPGSSVEIAAGGQIQVPYSAFDPSTGESDLNGTLVVAPADPGQYRPGPTTIQLDNANIRLSPTPLTWAGEQWGADLVVPGGIGPSDLVLGIQIKRPMNSSSLVLPAAIGVPTSGFILLPQLTDWFLGSVYQERGGVWEYGMDVLDTTPADSWEFSPFVNQSSADVRVRVRAGDTAAWVDGTTTALSPIPFDGSRVLPITVPSQQVVPVGKCVELAFEALSGSEWWLMRTWRSPESDGTMTLNAGSHSATFDRLQAKDSTVTPGRMEYTLHHGNSTARLSGAAITI